MNILFDRNSCAIPLHIVAQRSIIDVCLTDTGGGYSDCYGIVNRKGGRSGSAIVGGGCETFAEKQAVARLHRTEFLAHSTRGCRGILGTAIQYEPGRKHTNQVVEANLLVCQIAHLLQRSSKHLCNKL
jgi:hypothetical protein